MAVTEPRTIRTARVDFIDLPVKLIHIPLKSYPHYIQSLLQILFPLAAPANEEHHPNGSGSYHDGSTSWMNRHNFLSLSITPNECSLFCPADLADRYFTLPSCKPRGLEPAIISPETYTAISVEGEGLDAGQRVLELTTPLAIAGISIFFITTYFSDYILVPTHSRTKVVKALEARGFVFDSRTHQHGEHEAGLPRNHHHRRMTSSSFGTENSPPELSQQHSQQQQQQLQSTPTISELQTRTLALLRKFSISPTVRRDIRLIHCAARADPSSEADVQLGLVRCLANPPRLLSITLTATEPASLLLEPGTAPAFFGGAKRAESALARAESDVLVAIVLDLGKISLESSGIVCGLASKLADSKAGDGDREYEENGRRKGIEMSYLSTVRGAAVLVAEEEVDAAVAALRAGGEESGMDIE